MSENDPAPPASQADYLGSATLEDLTGIPASTWRYWAVNDTGPRSFKLGRRRVWKKSDVVEWIERQREASDQSGESALS